MQRDPKHSVSTTEIVEEEERKTLALALIHQQRTMVLATAADGAPWAAPVYFVYHAPGFYFFSSPRARHVEEGLGADVVAASIFADSDQWDQIQGLQMSGRLQWVQKKTKKIAISARFILKFPFAEPFLRSGQEVKRPRATPDIANRVQLYMFEPSEVYYLNNRLGFGQRIPMALT
ncbi:MAG: pyridoxamine 5'-phosphate oxidase family protein [Desulfobacteraceae bacterium]|nr:pyridoxamine 5'-phosphate oxidase family protein [Desulfobacteraceae bacterium]